MNYRTVDDAGVVHYADRRPLYPKSAYIPWCDLPKPTADRRYLGAARPRNQAVTCLFCLHIRHGARSGKAR